MFHGNAGNHGHRIPLARVILLNMRCNVLMMSYRGYIYSTLPNLGAEMNLATFSYGLSEGSPSERGELIFPGS